MSVFNYCYFQAKNKQWNMKISYVSFESSKKVTYVLPGPDVGVPQ